MIIEFTDPNKLWMENAIPGLSARPTFPTRAPHPGSLLEPERGLTGNDNFPPEMAVQGGKIFVNTG